MAIYHQATTVTLAAIVACQDGNVFACRSERTSHKKPQIIIMLANPLKPTSDTSISAFGKARSTVDGAPLSAEELRKIHAYWCACNYLAIGMIYLRDNLLLRAPLKIEQIKHRLLGHWGTSPGLSFVYTHPILNAALGQWFASRGEQDLR